MGFYKGCSRRADVGSELSAASGRRSEVSEWPRSKFPASAVRQRGNFGHRNRIIGPYEGVVGADDPVRPGPITQRLVGQGPCALPWVRENLIRADVGIGPYGWVARSA